MTLPVAVPQNPACGACGTELRFGSDGSLVCEQCLLRYDDVLTASYMDPDAKPCGAPCDNWWHGDDRIKKGWRFNCRPCQLPAGHVKGLCWTGCERLPFSAGE